jgi:hypothetical protein
MARAIGVEVHDIMSYAYNKRRKRLRWERKHTSQVRYFDDEIPDGGKAGWFYQSDSRNIDSWERLNGNKSS